MNFINHPIIGFFLLLVLFPGAGELWGQRGAVVAPRSRDQALANARSLLNPEDTGIHARLLEVDYPFDFYRAPVEMATEVAEEKPKVVEVTYSDEEVLQAVAATIRPSGMVIRGTQRILVLPNGNLAENSTLNVNFRGQPYEILLEQIRIDGYVLRLNEATLTRHFDGNQSGRIQRDPQPEP